MIDRENKERKHCTQFGFKALIYGLVTYNKIHTEQICVISKTIKPCR